LVGRDFWYVFWCSFPPPKQKMLALTVSVDLHCYATFKHLNGEALFTISSNCSGVFHLHFLLLRPVALHCSSIFSYVSHSIMYTQFALSLGMCFIPSTISFISRNMITAYDRFTQQNHSSCLSTIRVMIKSHRGLNP